MPRNLSGEQAVVATSRRLRKDTYTPGRISTSLKDTYDFFLLIERLKTTGGLDENSDHPVSQKLMAAFERGLHGLCRLKSVHVRVLGNPGLVVFMQAFRQTTNNAFPAISLLDAVPITYFDLTTRLN